MRPIGRNHTANAPEEHRDPDTITLTNRVQQVKEGDYVSEEDGLLYCGVCRRPKQVRITVNGQTKIQNCRCACPEEETETPAPAPGKLKRYPGCTFSRLGEDLQAWELEFRFYAEMWEECREHGIGLLLDGDPGVGKTFYAACIGNHVKDLGGSVTMVPVSELVSVTRALEGERQSRIRRKLELEDLLILDDLWMEALDSDATELLLSIVDNRSINRRPTIVTTRMQLDRDSTLEGLPVRQRMLAEKIRNNYHITLLLPEEGLHERAMEILEFSFRMSERFCDEVDELLLPWLEQLRQMEEVDPDAG